MVTECLWLRGHLNASRVVVTVLQEQRHRLVGLTEAIRNRSRALPHAANLDDINPYSAHQDFDQVPFQFPGYWLIQAFSKSRQKSLDGMYRRAYGIGASDLAP